MQPDDPELLTRHEVLAAPPDVLITNYSMLEYMLMRPLERPIFDHTRQWLADNPEEKFLLIVDEAHLYRGAAGAEVALLLRRLAIPAGHHRRIGSRSSPRARASATPEYAREFAAQLTGKDVADFRTVTSQSALRSGAAHGHRRRRDAARRPPARGLLRRRDGRRHASPPSPTCSTDRGVGRPGPPVGALLHDALLTTGR